MHIRIFSPSLTHRISDPMPLPKRSSAARRVRIHVRKMAVQKPTGTRKFQVKKVPLGR